ncbi:MAG: AraC family transcriptional regulator, partial [Prevotella sp.]
MTRFLALCHGEDPKLLISVPMLLLAIFMVISYIMYPIEVISPGYLNFRRIVKLYSPWLVLALVYCICLQVGIIFKPYHSLFEMLPEVTEFQVWFRLLLSMLVFAPVLFIFTIPYTRRYNNTNRTWILKYTITFTVNILAYMIVLSFDTLIIKTVYYYVSAGCSIYIAYMELFERLIEQRSLSTGNIDVPSPDNPSAPAETLSVRRSSLCEKITLHMKLTCDYRDPDISLNMLAASLCTNRTTLS